MLSHEAGTRLGHDLEELHDMRVATRRLRAAFVVFRQSFLSDFIKPYQKALRFAGRALGHARDMDVILEKANRYLDHLSDEERSGMESLIRYWQEERDHARENMLTYLGSHKYKKFINKLNIFINTPGLGAVSTCVDHPISFNVRVVAPTLIYTRLEAVRGYEAILANATIAQLHSLRIECKRLRYTVEFFREVLGTQAKTVINELKSIQDHLGELHDADVACQIVRHS